MSKYLLVTSDDFGMAHAVNKGIVRGMTQGFIKSTNFLVPCPWFREAVDLAKEHKLEVGVHLCTTCDWDRMTWGPLTGNPRLMTATGSLPAQHVGLEESGATDADIYDELKAQIKLVKKLYGEPTHIETHMMNGERASAIRTRIVTVVERLAKEFGLMYTYQRNVDNSSMYFTAPEFGMSGLSQDELLKELATLQAPGIYHVYGHAAEDEPELDALASPTHPSRHWTRDWRVKDMAHFTDQDLRQKIEAQGFQLLGVPALRQHLGL